MSELAPFAGYAAMPALLLVLSLWRSAALRFEAPYVLFSLLLLGRLAAEAAAAFLLPGGAPPIPALPAAALPLLATYPLLIGLLRFLSAGYGPKGSGGRPGWKRAAALSLPLLLADALRQAASAAPGSAAVGAASSLIAPLSLWAPLAALSSLALVIVSIPFLLPREAKA